MVKALIPAVMGNQFTRVLFKKKKCDEKSNQRSIRGFLDEQSIKDQALAMAKHEFYMTTFSSQAKMLKDTAIEPPRHSYSGTGNHGRIEGTRSYSSQVRRDIDSLLDPIQSMHLRKVI